MINNLAGPIPELGWSGVGDFSIELLKFGFGAGCGLCLDLCGGCGREAVGVVDDAGSPGESFFDNGFFGGEDVDD